MIEKTIQNCGKCGLCLNSCPVYKVLKEEQSSPRAKLQLIKAYENDTLSSSPLLKEIISKCLMCGSCSAACPSGIDHYSKFMKMRENMVEEQGETPAIKSLIYLLAREYRVKLGAGIARTGQKLMPGSIAKNYKLGNIALNSFPKLNSTPFRKACETIIMPDRKPVGTLVYFTGCATNHLYGDTGSSVIGILKHMGYKIIIPKDQTCCSIPLLFHGAKAKAFKNIAANINALKGHDADNIIVDCSTCGEALKKEYPRLIEEQCQDSFAAKNIASKVMDILSFTEKNFHRLEFEQTAIKNQTVTYHTPCHSKNSFGSHIIAEKLISKLPFTEYKKALDTEECCGGGGTFFYEYPEISKKMVGEKIKNAKALNADFWLTDCPVCRMNLQGNLDRKDLLKVLHPATLIHDALKKN